MRSDTYVYLHGHGWAVGWPGQCAPGYQLTGQAGAIPHANGVRLRESWRLLHVFCLWIGNHVGAMVFACTGAGFVLLFC